MNATMVQSARQVFHDLGDEDVDTTVVAEAPLPERIGGYAIKRRIGRGGMGVVYEAEQERPRRTVALKVMHRGVGSRSIQRRFEREAELLARLRHPGIAQVYDAGTHAPRDLDIGPVPFFAMEYVPGARSITEYADAAGLDARGRLRLFLDVLAAVEHGHGSGVLHRDLKPANILVDEHGQVKVIDFGVACSLDVDAGTRLTEVGQLLGTLQYMSPEQLLADSSQLDARSDLYALGVVLYELLTGELPYDVRKEPIHEATRIIREKVPRMMSVVKRDLLGDLDTICAKLLEKNRDHRYASIAALQGDITRYLADEPIEARPTGAFRRLVRVARRNRVITALAGALGLVLMASFGLITHLYLQFESDALEQREQSAKVEAELRGEIEALQGDLARILGEDVDGADGVRLGVLPEAPAMSLFLVDPKETEVALRDLTRAAARMDELEARTRGHAELRVELAQNYERLGDLIAAAAPADGESGQRFYLRSLAMTEEPLDGAAPSASARSASAASPATSTDGADGWRKRRSVGRLMAKVGRYEQASRELERGHDLCSDALASAPSNPRLVADLAAIAVELGDVRAHLLDLDGARACYEQSRELAQRAALEHVERAARKRLVLLAAHEGDCQEAWRSACVGVANTPCDPADARIVALGHAACGRLDQAVATAKAAILELKQGDAGLRRLRLEAALQSDLSGYERRRDAEAAGR